MIGDGHYLNTILELGPTLVATAVRLDHIDEKGDGGSASNTLFFY